MDRQSMERVSDAWHAIVNLENALENEGIDPSEYESHIRDMRSSLRALAGIAMVP